MFPLDDVIMDDMAARDLVMQGSRASAAMTQFSHNIAPLEPGGRLNKKDGLTRCGDSHVKDKTS